MELDPRQLRHLLALARHGSFGKAARSLNLSQPALSVSIARLEDQVGLPLAVRRSDGARLTSAGETLLRHARTIEGTLQRAQADLASARDGTFAPLIIGATPVAARLCLAPALVTAAGHRLVRIVEADGKTLGEALRLRRLDLALLDASADPRAEDETDIPLRDLPLLLAMRAEHPLANSAPAFADLPRWPWILPPSGTLRQIADALFLSRGLQPPPVRYEADLPGAGTDLLLATNALSLVPEPMLALPGNLLVGRPLPDAAPVLRLMLRHHNRPMTADAARLLQQLLG